MTDTVHSHGLAASTRMACTRGALRTSLPTTLVVGTLINVLQQGDVLLAGGVSPATWAKMGITYAIPRVVSSLGYVRGGLETPHPPEGT